jgi:integrase
VYHRIGKTQRRITLGTLDEVKAGDARRKARDDLVDRRLGIDERVSTEGRKWSAIVPAHLTVLGLIERYLEYKKAQLRPRSFDNTSRHLRKHEAALYELQPEQARKRDLSALFTNVAEASGGSAANHARASLSALFTWAIQSGLVNLESNPVVGTPKPAREVSRGRILTHDELRAVWWATDGPGDYAAIVRHLMLTGARRQEVAGLAWSELKLDRAEWLLPAARSKNGRAHLVPLSDAALTALRVCPARADRDLISARGRARSAVSAGASSGLTVGSRWPGLKRQVAARPMPLPSDATRCRPRRPARHAGERDRLRRPGRRDRLARCHRPRDHAPAQLRNQPVVTNARTGSPGSAGSRLGRQGSARPCCRRPWVPGGRPST